jgi:hypothetical protein
MGMVDEWTHFG